MDKEGYLVKKVSIIFLAIFLIPMMLPAQTQAKEKTLDQLIAEAKAIRDAYNEAKNQKQMTEQERNEAIKQKQDVEAQISQIQKEVEETSSKIDSLQKDIDKKDEQMKDIMSFVQVTEGENNYLEYIFGATSFTDFIYRISVAEQLGDYNEQLVKEYESDVKELDERQTELQNQEVELNKKQQELSVLEAQLNQKIETLQSGIISKDQEYKTQISLINSMKSRGCKGSDTVTSCQERLSSGSGGGGVLVSTNGTYMPIASGTVTSDYGYRTYDDSFHTGIDFSRSVAGDAVYPVADGEVILLDNNPSCGNHIVYVKHNINGHSYITSYWHLRSWSVRVGQKVSYTTKIGEMAGRNSGDKCSGGIHVHLNLFDNANNQWENRVARGGNPNSGRINPRTAIPQIPKKGQSFSHR